MKIRTEPAEILSLDGPEPGSLVLADGRLAAVLIHLEAEFYEDDRGSWNLEKGFGACDIGALAPFPRLADAVAWVGRRLGASQASIAEALDALTEPHGCTPR